MKDDLYVVGECAEGEHGHEAVRVYLLENEGRPILIDTGSHLHKLSVMGELESLLEGRAPEVVFLTHTELSHTGNVRAIMGRWPRIVPVASGLISAYIELAPIVELEKITLSSVGESATFAGRTFGFVHGVLKDQPGTQWIYDMRTKTLFTADAFGYFHAPGECDLLSDEKQEGIRVEDFLDYHRMEFRFLRWVEPERVGKSIDQVFERDVRVIAPTHGNPITNDIHAHVER